MTLFGSVAVNERYPVHTELNRLLNEPLQPVGMTEWRNSDVNVVKCWWLLSLFLNFKSALALVVRQDPGFEAGTFPIRNVNDIPRAPAQGPNGVL